MSMFGGADASTWRRNQARYADCTSRLGNVVGTMARISAATAGVVTAASVSSSTVRVHSSSVGPGQIGPAQCTESSVKIVTSSAIEFIHSRCDRSGRHTRPWPAGNGSTRWIASARSPSSSGALATMRSSREDAVGPAPMTTNRAGAAATSSAWPIGAA